MEVHSLKRTVPDLHPVRRQQMEKTIHDVNPTSHRDPTICRLDPTAVSLERMRCAVGAIRGRQLQAGDDRVGWMAAEKPSNPDASFDFMGGFATLRHMMKAGLGTFVVFDLALVRGAQSDQRFDDRVPGSTARNSRGGDVSRIARRHLALEETF